MPVVINGSTGISGNDGSASVPTIQGTDGNTGMFFPAADQIAFAEGGVEAMRLDASGNVGIGTSSPGQRLDVRGISAAGNGTISTGISWDSRGLVGTLSNHSFGLMANQTVGAVLDASSNFAFNSGYGSVATAFGCRAWVNFNGTGTPAIRASGNVSSITDLGVGDYRVNFTNSMPDANYATTTGFTVANLSSIIWVQAQLASSVRIITYDAGAPFDNANIFAASFR